MKKLITMILAAVALISLCSCEHLDNKRIPWAEVRVAFNSPAEWETYGVAGAMDHRRFIKSERIPSNYPYTSLTYTGYGGILLVTDVQGVPQAYDLSCPVEMNIKVRVNINPETHLAECPECHSTYDVFINQGASITGIAAQRGYGLTRYRVAPGQAGEYYLISR